MRVVVAPQGFKGTLSAVDACAAMELGVLRAWPQAEVRRAPVADGGAGTVRTLLAALGGTMHETVARGPLGDPVTAVWGALEPDESTAVIEVAAACGHTLAPSDRRDALAATSHGAGTLIRAALDHGCRRLIIGLGDSATTDAGTGLLTALGLRLLDAGGHELGPGGGELHRLAAIDSTGLDARLAACEIVVACDVNSPLLGPTGAAAAYGPQKGASPEQVAVLEDGLRRFCALVSADVESRLGAPLETLPGTGSAGGIGAGLLAFTPARLHPGFDLIAGLIGLRATVAGANLVLTGEGRIDGQTARGKGVAGVVRLAREVGAPVVALAGSLGPGAEALYAEGVAAMLVASATPGDPASASEHLAQGAETACRLIGLGGRW